MMSAKRKHSDDYGTPGFVCVFLLCVCRLPPPLQWAQPAEERSPICTCMAHLEFFHSPSHHQPLLLLLPYRSPATALPAPTHHRCRLAVAAVAAPCCLLAGCCRRLARILYTNLLFSSSLWLHTFARLFPPHYSLLNPEHNALYPLHLPPTHQPPPLSAELSSVVCIGCSITAAAATKTTHLTTQPPAGTRTLGSTPSFLWVLGPQTALLGSLVPIACFSPARPSSLFPA